MGSYAGTGYTHGRREDGEAITTKKVIRQRMVNGLQTSLRKQRALPTNLRRTDSTSVDWMKTLVRKVGQEGSPINTWRYQDLLFKKQTPQADKLVCLVLDCSGSMMLQRNLSLAKRLLLPWVERLYQQRHRLAVLGFSGSQVQLLQPARKAVAFNETWISAIRGGGGTPVGLGLARADELLLQAKRKQPGLRTELWLLTDGRVQQLPAKPVHADLNTVIDFEQHSISLGKAKQIAQLWQSDYLVATDFYETHVSTPNHTQPMHNHSIE